MTDLTSLGKVINYDFKDNNLLKQALTHSSFSAKHNERLEFLGDSLLNCIITTYLFATFPKTDEGVLTRMRANLVKGESLYEIGVKLGVADYLLLGNSEKRSGGIHRRSNIADAIEAIIGAVYLDSDFSSVKEFVLNLYQDKLANLNPKMAKDPKTILQEKLQKKAEDLPVYNLISETRNKQDITFVVECVVKNYTTTAKALSKRMAEQLAAKEMLAKIDD